jgi:hypothetical protein
MKSWVSYTDLENLETMHFQIYVDTNYFYYLHMRNLVYKAKNTVIGIRHADNVAPYIRKSRH